MTTEIITQPEQLPANQSDAVMQMISKVANDPSFDPVKLEKLMDLQERVLNREAHLAYTSDFVRMKPELPIVLKTKNNGQTKSDYATLDNINKEIDPILAKHGFGTQTRIISQDDAGVRVEAILMHRGGHSERTEIFMPIDNKGIAGTVNKTMPHAVSSSITYAKRVAICALLNISTGDDKDGNNDKAILPNEYAVEIDQLITETKTDKVRFLKFMGTDSVQNILAKDYLKAKTNLEKKRAGK